MVLLAININNIWYAGYLYRSIAGVAGFAMGMTLLFGPLYYLYTLSVIRPDFRFRWIQLLHLIPYALMFSFLFLGRDSGYDPEQALMVLEQFMKGELPANAFTVVRFLIYSSHLLIYIFLANLEMSRSLKSTDQGFLVPLEERVKWLKKLSAIFLIVGLILVGLTIYIFVTKTYTVKGNFILTLVLSVVIYLFAYQSILNNKRVIPDFASKYGNYKLKDQVKDSLLTRILELFESEQIFLDPELKISTLADRLETNPHVVSKVINNGLNKTFYELLNYYRIEEFKKLASSPEYSNHSIMGIAYEVGYSSKSSFNTAFKKQTGSTPSVYIKSLTA